MTLKTHTLSSNNFLLTFSFNSKFYSLLYTLVFSLKMDLRQITLKFRQLNIKSFIKRRLLWLQLRRRHFLICLLIFVPLFYLLNFLNCWLFLNCTLEQPTNIPPFLITRKVPVQKAKFGQEEEISDDNLLVGLKLFWVGVCGEFGQSDGNRA